MRQLLAIRDLASLTKEERRGILERENELEQAIEKVRPILRDVKERGDAAVVDWTRRFDGVERGLRVEPAEFRSARKLVDAKVVRALRASIAAVRKVSVATKPKAKTVVPLPGVRVREEWLPFRRAGCYVPGGKAAYPSTVVMTVVPAVAAGVDEIFVASPPRKDGRLPPVVLVAAELSGATSVFAMGGAQAIGAFAFGTKSVPRADVVVGPGNAYVTAAKFLVSDSVAIDSLAGPSELLLLADDSANVAWVVRDLLAQAEHSEDAKALLVTTSRTLAERVLVALAAAVESAPRRDVLVPALRDHGHVLVAKDLGQAVAFAEAYAAEHLQIMMRGAERLAPKFRTSGTVFAVTGTPTADATGAVAGFADATGRFLPRVHAQRDEGDGRDRASARGFARRT
jgi:histidinol dehydrogenase